MIAIDALVHNFLVRTGILARFAADHSYGAACYRAGMVGGHRARSHRRHAYAAVSGLPEAAQVCSPSCGGRVDEPSG
jgi:hypothetical protein